MRTYLFTSLVFVLFLLLTVNGDESNDHDNDDGTNFTEICKDLCKNCDGIGSYVDGDGCICHIDIEKPETAQCVDKIKNNAAKRNLTLTNIQSKVLDRTTRCCPSNNRLRLSDIIRVAKYFMNNAQGETRILGNHRNFNDDVINNPADCQHCLDDEEDPSVDISMPDEESIDIYDTTPTSSIQYRNKPQIPCPIHHAHPYNNNNNYYYKEPNIENFDQIQPPYDHYHSLLPPLAPVHDCSRDHLSPVSSSSYPRTRTVPLTPKACVSPHNRPHLHRGYIERPHAHLPTSSYPQYSSIRNPHRGITRLSVNGMHNNYIEKPSYLQPSVSQMGNIGVGLPQPYQSRISDWTRPIVQPSHTLYPPGVSEMSHLPQSNNMRWPLIIPRGDMYNGMGQQFIPYSDFLSSTGNNYQVDPILGVANPNSNEANNKNEENIQNASGQQIISENKSGDQSPIASTRSDIAVQIEKSTSPPQISNPQTNGNTFLVNIPNPMKRTMPASLRYRQMNKRELKMKTL